MKFTISGKNIDVTEGLKAAVRDKLGKLERYFTPDTEVIVTMSVEKERQKIEVTIPVKGNIIRSELVSNDMYVSIDLVKKRSWQSSRMEAISRRNFWKKRASRSMRYELSVQSVLI